MSKILAALIATVFAVGAYAADTKPAAAASAPKSETKHSSKAKHDKAASAPAAKKDDAKK
jgi:hypothetical protein